MKETDNNNSKKKRVPWHVTLFAGAAWFLLCGGAQASVLVVSGLMLAGGVLYIFWPRIASGHGDKTDP